MRSGLEFERGAARIAQVLQHEGWVYENRQLQTTMMRPRHSSSPAPFLPTDGRNDTDVGDDYGVDSAILQDPDTVIIANNENKNGNPRVAWKFSIVYHEIFRVPVLYFSVQLGDQPMTRSQVLEELLSYNNANNTTTTPTADDTWDFVSSEEHPITGLPCFFLHPCRTQDRLGTLFSLSSTTTSNGSVTDPAVLLWSWCAMLFPSVGLEITPSQFQRVQKQLLLPLETTTTSEVLEPCLKPSSA